MHFGIEIVPFGEFADPRWVVRLAQAADEAGWEGIWLWDHLVFPYGVGDPWVMLSAVAAVTQHVRLIPGVAALPRYQPQLLARLLTSLDLLSQGRLVLGAGAGGIDAEFSSFGGPGDRRTRAGMLDESLDVLAGLWRGEPFDYQGRYYRVDGVNLQPKPLQQPRPPVWIGGESQAALRRAARWDGWIMGTTDENGQLTRPPEQLAREVAAIRQFRDSDRPFDVAVDGISAPGETALAREFAGAGATWWFEAIYPLRARPEALLERIKAGPPCW